MPTNHAKCYVKNGIPAKECQSWDKLANSSERTEMNGTCRKPSCCPLPKIIAHESWFLAHRVSLLLRFERFWAENYRRNDNLAAKCDCEASINKIDKTVSWSEKRSWTNRVGDKKLFFSASYQLEVMKHVSKQRIYGAPGEAFDSPVETLKAWTAIRVLRLFGGHRLNLARFIIDVNADYSWKWDGHEFEKRNWDSQETI